MLSDESLKRSTDSRRSWVSRANEDLYVLSNLVLALACFYAQFNAVSSEVDYHWCVSITNICLVMSALLLLLEVVPSYRHSKKTRRLLMGGNELLRGVAIGLICCGLWNGMEVTKDSTYATLHDTENLAIPTKLIHGEERVDLESVLRDWLTPSLPPARRLEVPTAENNTLSVEELLQDDLMREVTFPHEISVPAVEPALVFKPTADLDDNDNRKPRRNTSFYMQSGITLLFVSLCIEVIVAFNRHWITALKDLCCWNGKHSFITRISGLAIRFWAGLVSTVCLAMIVFTRAPGVVGMSLNEQWPSIGCSYVCQLNLAHGFLALFGLVVCLNPSLRGSTGLHWLFCVGFATNVFAMLVSAFALREMDTQSPAQAAEKEVFLFQVLLLLCCAPVWAHHNALRRWKKRMQRVGAEFEEVHWTQQHKMVPSVNTV